MPDNTLIIKIPRDHYECSTINEASVITESISLNQRPSSNVTLDICIKMAGPEAYRVFTRYMTGNLAAEVVPEPKYLTTFAKTH